MRQFVPEEIADWCAGEWSPGVPEEIGGFSKDSRSILQGEAYVALSGDNFNGHDFVSDAVESGASCAVVDAAFSGEVEVPILRVENTLKALQDVASSYRTKCAPFVVGVTGSSGKTTVKEMIAACLSTTSRTTATVGNLNNHIGLPLSLLQMTADTECAVMEVGMNHPGELADLCEILRPDWSVVTNVGPVHLESFESVEDIAAEKSVLIRKTSRDGLVFLDADGEYFEVLSAAVGSELVTLSRGRDADYMYAQLGASSVRILETASGETCDVHLPLPGRHIAFDAALAAAVARRRGIEWDAISLALSEYVSPPMRWQIEECGGVRVINDAYNANPMSMRASIEAFASQECSGRKHLILGDMLELGSSAASEHEELGEWLEGKGISILIGVGAESRAIVTGATANCERATAVDQAGEAAEALTGDLSAGDSVLIKGSRGIHLEDAAKGLQEFLNQNQ